MKYVFQDDDVFFIANERGDKWLPEIKIKRQTSRPFVLSSNGLSGAGSKFLRKVELPIVSIDVCSKSTRGFEDLDPRTQFCAGGEKG